MKIENDVVCLRLVEIEDIKEILEVAKDERIWTYMSDYLMTEEAVEAYVKKAIAERELGLSFKFVIIDQQTGKIVGSTSFINIVEPHKRLEIGATWLCPAVWHTAINTNCKYLLFKYCFEELRLNRVEIKTGHENLRSQKAIERIGARKEGVLRNHMVQRNGAIRHTVMYSITEEDWPEVKARFENTLL